MEDTRPRGVALTLDTVPEGSKVSILVAAKEKKDAHVSIKIDPRWVNSIKRKNLMSPAIIKSSSASDSCSIHRVPQCFRQHDEKAYLPQVISIGPFHYAQRRDHLRAMEEHKWRYLRSVLGRNGDNCLESYLIAIKTKEERIRQCYSENIDLNSNTLVEMMVLDGCFMIELFQRAMILKNKNVEEYKDDPILQLGWLRDNLMRDLVMLENQIPFFVLKCLLDLMGISVSYLADCALEFFTFSLVKRRYECHLFPQVQHLLHLLHSSLLPLPMEKILMKKHSSKGTRFINENSEGGTIEMIHCVSELEQAGIKFKKGRATCKVKESFLAPKLRRRKNTLKEDSEGEEFHSFLDIKFQNGVIEIPTLKVEDSTGTLFLNLVAFEQCYRHCKPYFTGYTYFMDCLIDSEKDVQILCQNEIIDRRLGSNQDVADLFNKMGREVILCHNDFYLCDVFDSINRYYRSVWHVWGASLKHNYFNSPWTIISVIAGIFLLVLTCSQTFFSAFPELAFGKRGNHQPSSD